jgi:hypothetical protein
MMIAQSLPPEACSIVVPLVADKTPLCLLGISARGDGVDLDAVAAAATARGLKTSRLAHEGEPAEQMVGFVPGTSSADVAAMVAAMRAGRFGKATVKVLVALQSAAADGIDLQGEGGYLDPAAVVLPPG